MHSKNYKPITQTAKATSDKWYVDGKGFLRVRQLPYRRITGINKYDLVSDDTDVISNYVGR